MMIWYGAITEPGNIGVSDRGLDRLALDIIYTSFSITYQFKQTQLHIN